MRVCSGLSPPLVPPTHRLGGAQASHLPTTSLPAGIVFIDEIDKIVTSTEHRYGGDASAEGVQRDLLPIIEGEAGRGGEGLDQG